MLSCLVYLHTEPRSAESYPRPLALSSKGSLEGLVVPQSPSPDLLPADHSPRTCLGTVEVSAYYPPNLFRINTCKSLSKQTTLTVIMYLTQMRQWERDRAAFQFIKMIRSKDSFLLTKLTVVRGGPRIFQFESSSK